MTAVTWEEALQQLEGRLDRAEQAIAEPGGGRAVEPFTAPAVAGPLPPALAERAQALLLRAEELRRIGEAESARIRGELHRLARRAPAPAGPPTSLFETRA
jgi:hypothetical protein